MANLLEVTKKYPTLVIGNSPARTSLKNASVCIHAVAGDFKKFAYIRSGKEVVGAYFASKRLEHLSLSGVSASGSMARKDFKKEAQSVYKRIDVILSRFHFSPRSTYRFWNYMEDISKNYRSFNAARNWYYAKHGIRQFPAATGIEAGLSGSAQIRIGLEALKSANKKGVMMETVASDMQNEAWEYGPKFSRAVLVRFPRDGVKKLYISGTSSVDKKGKTISSDSREENISYVLDSVGHLLKKNGMSLGNLLTSYVYCKNADVLKAFERLYATKKWNFPYNPVITNICRDDFLFEIECIATNSVVVERIRTQNGCIDNYLL